MHKIVPQSGIDSVRVLFGLPLLFIDPDELLSLPGVFAKTIVSDPIKPGGKLRFPAKGANFFVSANESVLRQIIGQGDIAAGELPQ